MIFHFKLKSKFFINSCLTRGVRLQFLVGLIKQTKILFNRKDIETERDVSQLMFFPHVQPDFAQPVLHNLVKLHDSPLTYCSKY